MLKTLGIYMNDSSLHLKFKLLVIFHVVGSKKSQFLNNDSARKQRQFISIESARKQSQFISIDSARKQSQFISIDSARKQSQFIIIDSARQQSHLKQKDYLKYLFTEDTRHGNISVIFIKFLTSSVLNDIA